ncbi:MAG: stage III sporulation protein AF [Oscillospiraceae bacterium]|jgi:hypothetical protein|nr:stage III sporulation protein AF [Oscillospiraceae bacterium]
MSDILRSWILGIAGASLITAITLAVTPESRAKKAVSLACGFVMIIALLRPIGSFDYAGFKLSFSRLREQSDGFSAPLEETNAELMKSIIQDGYAAYISDKGKALGVTRIEAAVEAELHSDGFWYPVRAYVTVSGDKTLRERLAFEIESGLGLAPEELVWGEFNEQG